MRIITGKYKGRHFDIPHSFKARPTTDFAKENIFNVLMHYVDFDATNALDLFSGTGSITLELLSRGCSPVVSVELDRDHHRFIRQCIEKLNGDRQTQPSQLNVQCVRGDAFRYIKSCRQQFGLVFADPPYALKELSTIPSLIFEHGLLRPGGILVMEHGKDCHFDDHPHFLEHRAYGSVNFSLFKSE